MNEIIISQIFISVNAFLKKKYNFFGFLHIFLQVARSKLAFYASESLICQNNSLIYILMKEKFLQNMRWICIPQVKNVFLVTVGCVHRIFNQKIFVLF